MTGNHEPVNQLTPIEDHLHADQHKESDESEEGYQARQYKNNVPNGDLAYKVWCDAHHEVGLATGLVDWATCHRDRKLHRQRIGKLLQMKGIARQVIDVIDKGMREVDKVQAKEKQNHEDL